MDPDAEIILVSGFHQIDETGLAKAYQSRADSNLTLDSYASIEDDDIIFRCRLLRSLDAAVARHHVLAMRAAVRDMLDRVAPDVLISESIDQFLHDILFREARVRGIHTFGLIRSFVNGYYRISERGEMVVSRVPSEEEVNLIKGKLTDDTYIPRNLVSLKKSPLVTYVRIMLGNNARILYFLLRRMLTGQTYNYHYWVSERITRQEYQHFIPLMKLGDASWLAKVTDRRRPVVYIPLQHFPEATIDYWVQHVVEVNYPERLKLYIKKLSTDFTVLIKEHPGVWGYRKPDFYRGLGPNSDIVICPTNVPSQECIAAADAVFVWTGSVGFEAALRGKAVLSVCQPYYAKGPRFLEISLSTPNEDIRKHLYQCSRTPVSVTETNHLVSWLLGGMFPGRFQNDGSFTLTNPNDDADAKAIGADLRSFYDYSQLGLTAAKSNGVT